MSDRGRSFEEIEREIDRRQDELADDLEDLEYRFSREGVKDEAQERMSEARQALESRAQTVREQARERLESLSAQAQEVGSKAADSARRYGPMAAIALGSLAAGTLLFMAVRRKRRSGERRQARQLSQVRSQQYPARVRVREQYQVQDWPESARE